MLEDADGSLLVIDTGGWFRIGCPTSQIAKPEIKGAIYRVRRTDAATSTIRADLALEWNKLDATGLVKLLVIPGLPSASGRSKRWPAKEMRPYRI